LGIEEATVEIQHGVALVRKCQCRDAGETVGAAAQEGPVYEAQASFPKVGRPRAQAPRRRHHEVSRTSTRAKLLPLSPEEPPEAEKQ
jgi:hypothetical protein